MKEEFKNRLQKALSDSGMSAAELSEKSGISEANISNYLKGKYVAKQDKVYLLAKALDVDPGWLMVGGVPPIVSGHSSYIMYDMDNPPTTSEARILAKGIDKLGPEQRAQALAVVKAMFANHPELFDEERE